MTPEQKEKSILELKLKQYEEWLDKLTVVVPVSTNITIQHNNFIDRNRLAIKIGKDYRALKELK